MYTVIIIGLVVYFLLVLIVGRQLAYNDILPKVRPNRSNALGGFNFRNIEFRNHDNKVLKGWFILAENNPSNKTIFILHGWTRTRLKYIDQIKFFVNSGFHVFTYDQISHGDSELGPVTFGEMEGRDLLLAVDFSKSFPEINQEKIAVLGFSLGTGTAIYATAYTPNPVFKAIILEGAFANSYDVGETILISRFGFILGKLIGHAFFTFGTQIWSLGRFNHSNTAETIAKIKNIPILIIRGENDALVPQKSADKLISSANPPVEVWTHALGHHTRAYETYPKEYEKRVLTFLNKYL